MPLGLVTQGSKHFGGEGDRLGLSVPVASDESRDLILSHSLHVSCYYPLYRIVICTLGAYRDRKGSNGRINILVFTDDADRPYPETACFGRSVRLRRLAVILPFDEGYSQMTEYCRSWRVASGQ